MKEIETKAKEPMTIREFIRVAEDLKEHKPRLMDSPLLITLSEPSVGGRASTTVQGIYEGFDWEMGEIRVQPTESLVRLGNAQTDPKPIVHWHNPGGHSVYHCERCQQKVAKTDRFCKWCGKAFDGTIRKAGYGIDYAIPSTKEAAKK